MPVNLKQLTSMRFFAAVWVTLYHYWPSLSPTMPGVVAKGYLGVELFFVLSGFILSHVYLDQAGAGRLRYGAFLWARLSRIYPVHLAMIVAIGLMGTAAAAFGVKIDHPVTVWSVLPQNLLLIHAWGTASVSAWNHPSWSISAEWFAYVTFPFFAWGAWRLRTRPLLAVAGVSAGILVIYPLFERLAHFPLTHATIAWGALRIVPCFALGCAINLLWRPRGISDQTVALAITASSFIGIVAAAVVNAPDPLLVLLFGVLILGLAALASTGSRLLTSAPLVYLGEVSFAIYMVSIPWQLVFSKAVGRLGFSTDRVPLGVWILQLVGVVAAAALVHHLVERPFRLWMRTYDPSADRPKAVTLEAIVAS